MLIVDVIGIDMATNHKSTILSLVLEQVAFWLHGEQTIAVYVSQANTDCVMRKCLDVNR